MAKSSVHVKKDDQVIVISGKDKGAKGKVLMVDEKKGRVYVEGVNMVKKHQKARSQTAPSGIVEREGSIDASNVMLVDPKTGKPTRVGYRINEDGSKSRIAKRSGEVIDTVSKAKIQGILLTQGSNPCLLHWQADSLPLSHQGSPEYLILMCT